jgi:hypothetical protein
MRWRCDCFDQWRLNEMRLDAALRSQQLPKQTASRNVPHNASIISRTSITQLRASSTRRVQKNNDLSSPLVITENPNDECPFDFGNTV